MKHINSTDPKATPEIDPRYAQEPIDFSILREGFKFIRKVAQTAPWADHVEKEEVPGLEVQTDEQIDGTFTLAMWHL